MQEMKPHSSSLRKGRYSALGQAYFLTSATAGRRRLLTPDTREVVVSGLQWARS
jgi:hypothetical protein